MKTECWKCKNPTERVRRIGGLAHREFCDSCWRRVVLRQIRLQRVFNLLLEKGIPRVVANTYIISRWIDGLPKEVWWKKVGKS